MKGWIFTGLALAVWLWSLHIEVQFKPFKVSFHNWREALGIVLLCVGIYLVKYDYGRERYESGVKDCIKAITERIESLQKGQTSQQ